tara:strand:- start:405 stop:614 length:210 start_codon:yes stop_codon:yes gene_type:complete
LVLEVQQYLRQQVQLDHKVQLLLFQQFHQQVVAEVVEEQLLMQELEDQVVVQQADLIVQDVELLEILHP